MDYHCRVHRGVESGEREEGDGIQAAAVEIGEDADDREKECERQHEGCPGEIDVVVPSGGRHRQHPACQGERHVAHRGGGDASVVKVCDIDRHRRYLLFSRELR